MKLRKIEFLRYRQFIEETLELDPWVTVLVGRNDTGKTGVLNHFFDQCVYEGVISGEDRSMVPGYQGDRTAFSLTWQIFAEDYDWITFPPGFGDRGDHVLEISFRDSNGSGRVWSYSLDGRGLDIYEGTSAEGHAIMRKTWRPRLILPTPRYVSVLGPPAQNFEMHPYDQAAGAVEMERRQQRKFEHRILSVETKFLQLAGIRAQTRSPTGMNQPWPIHLGATCSMSTADLQARLESLAARVSEKLRAWWVDPPGLSLKIRLVEGVPGTYGLTWSLQDGAGLVYHGTGLLWFVGFVIEWLSIEDFPGPLLLLFDEPGTPLHPSAQRAAAKLIGSMSSRHQVIYSTHSPFLIDWNFPQRIRLFDRDYESKRTRILNKPYAPRESMQRIWDPLRESIGVTIGEVGILGSRNVLVEGVSDQILIANVSSALRAKGFADLGLPETTILPYGDKPSLEHMLAVVIRRDLKVVVITDDDGQGARIRSECAKHKIACLGVGEFSERTEGDRSIEDVLGIDFYIGAVNEWYGSFEWFQTIDRGEVRRELGSRSLGFYLSRLFKERFDRNFDKVGVMLSVIEVLDEMPAPIFQRLEAMIQRTRSLVSD